IVAHSMGGLVARAYMQQHKHNTGVFLGKDGGERVLKLITLATPHHGTPGANDKSRNEMARNADARENSSLRGWNDAWSTTINTASFLFYLDWATNNVVVHWNEPNRSDLLYDNFDNIMTATNEDVVNTYLQDLNKTSPYYAKIIAYWSYLD